MKRRLFNLAAGLSLGLALAVGALWVRSYWHKDRLTWDAGKTSQWITSFAGELMFARRSGLTDGPARWHYADLDLIREIGLPFQSPPTTWVERLGFVYINRAWSNGPGRPVRERGIGLPHGSLVLLLGVLPVWRVLAWRGARRSGQRGFAVGPASPA